MKRNLVKALGLIMAFSLTVTSVSVPALAAEESIPVEEEVLLDAPEDAEGKELTDALEEELGEQDSEELIEEEAEAAAKEAEEEAEDTEEEPVEEADEEEPSEGAGQEETDEADGEEPEEPEEEPAEEDEEDYEAEEEHDAEDELIDEETIEEAEDLLHEGEAPEVEDEDELLNLGTEHVFSPDIKVLSGTGRDYGDLIALECMTPGAQIFYVLDNREETLLLNDTNIVWDEDAGRFIAKSPAIKEYTTPIVIGVDTNNAAYKIHTCAVKKNLLMSDVVGDTLEYGPENAWGDIDPADQFTEFGDDLSKLEDPAYQGLWIPEAQRFDESIIYTGKAITIPDLRVYYGKKLLVPGTDYTLKYSQNVNTSNVAQVKVTLKGNYSGAKAFNFRINKLVLTTEDIKWSTVQVNAKKSKDYWTPQYPDPKITVISTGQKLKMGKDYQLYYKRDGESFYGDYINYPGAYWINVATSFVYSNYEFSGVTIPSVVFCMGGDMVAMNKCTVSKIATQSIEDWEGNGYNVTPEFSVKYKGTTLVAGNDGHYIPEFSNHAAAGTATLTLTGTNIELDGIRVNGTKVITFKITGMPINKNNTVIDGINETYEYSGFEIPAMHSYSVIRDGKELAEDTDYTVSYSKGGRVNAGKVTMTIKGKGIYAGTVTKSFKILPAETDNIVVKNTINFYEWSDLAAQYRYKKGGTTPDFIVTYYGTQLKPGTDYTVTYANNKAIGNYDAEKNGKRIGPSFTIKLKGNYKGSVTKYFTIQPQDIGITNMALSDLPASTVPNKFTQKVVITDTNGVALKAGVDYEKTLKYTYDEEIDITYKTGTGKNAKIETKHVNRYDEVQKDHIIPAGAVIRVTAHGINNYTENIYNTFTITENSIKNLKFTLDPAKTWYYTGKYITPGKDDIKVQMKVGKTWEDVPAEVAARYYDIVGYKNNQKAGTSAAISIKGKNGFAGTATIKFKILKAAQK